MDLPTRTVRSGLTSIRPELGSGLLAGSQTGLYLPTPTPSIYQASQSVAAQAKDRPASFLGPLVQTEAGVILNAVSLLYQHTHLHTTKPGVQTGTGQNSTPKSYRGKVGDEVRGKGKALRSESPTANAERRQDRRRKPVLEPNT